MSKATVRAHQRGLKNTLLWGNCVPATTEDWYAYGKHLEDLYQEQEAVIWYKKAADMGYVPAWFQLAMMMKNGWSQGDFHHLFQRVVDYDLNRKDVISYYRLGKCFTNGWGTQLDENAGWYWFQKALDACKEVDDIHPSLLYELSCYHREGLGGIEVDIPLSWKYLTMAHEKGCQGAVWDLWRLFWGNFSDFPFRRDYTEAWSFQLGRYLRAAEAVPSKDYFLRLSRFYEQGFPADSEENRMKMQRLAQEYADQAERLEKHSCVPFRDIRSSKGA